MRRVFSYGELRILSLALAVVILITSAPLSAGVIVVAGPRHPELTVDICHPAQTFDLAPAILLARPAPAIVETTLSESGDVCGDIASPPVELRLAPVTPPPKLPA